MKKKGLIISTVVMVVVLIASLTTATYAWFSATAEAKVENINVRTQAAEGLQVAVKSGAGQDLAADYVHGEVDFEKGKWSGDTSFGSLVDFNNITMEGGKVGTWDQAVARVDSKKQIGNGITPDVYKKYSTETDNATYSDDSTTFNEAAETAVYKVAEDGQRLVNVKNSDTIGDGTYYLKDTTFKEGDFLIPIGYNDSIEPIGYVLAVANQDYLSLPISIKPSKAVGLIYCSITISPSQGGMTSGWDIYGPGMAAAAHILISNGSDSFEFVPYDSVKLSEMDSQKSTAASGDFTLNFIIKAATSADADTGMIKPTEIFDWTFTIWVEGTDDFCDNRTTGSGFGIDISYGYEESYQPLTEETTPVTANGLSAGGSQATMKAITPKNKIEIKGTTYYEFI